MAVAATLFALALLASCASAPAAVPGELAGEWSYTLIDDANGNTWDAGTIRFHGGPDEGTWDLSNYYDIPYEGSWRSEEGRIVLEGGVSWTLAWRKPTELAGSWDAGTDGRGKARLARH